MKVRMSLSLIFILFPPVNSGGLIEALIIGVILEPAPARFPPVNSGGLIEAPRRGAR